MSCCIVSRRRLFEDEEAGVCCTGPELVIVEVQSGVGASIECASLVGLGGGGFRFGEIGEPGIRVNEELRLLERLSGKIGG
jgi:hypothetical protein